MLIDLHSHTSGISKCCRANCEQVIDKAKEVGIDGIVLTNHFQKSYLNGMNEQVFVSKYIQEYYDTKEIAMDKGFLVLFGIEVTMEQYPNVHMLIYGVEPSFLEENREIYEMSQAELYSLVKKYNGVLIQAHPYRNGTTVMDVNFMDGVEINCHPLYSKSYCAELIEIAKRDGMYLTCGGDYHADTYRPKCGLYLPENISTEKELVENICNENKIVLCVQEPYDDDVNIIEYLKI